MRINQPVTQKEVLLNENEFIVSTPELLGQISLTNKVFFDIYGFTEIELIGQHHNIARHTDMPAKACAVRYKSLKKADPG